MMKSFVLTLSGPDRIGVVERVTGLLAGRGGNVEASRMARLGGEFAMLMLFTMPEERVSGLEADLDALASQGYKVAATPASPTSAEDRAGWRSFVIEVRGADHEGIIHEIARYLSTRGINIETADSDTSQAPVSGSPLFAMTARVLAPPGSTAESLEAGLEAIADRLNLEIQVGTGE